MHWPIKTYIFSILAACSISILHAQDRLQGRALQKAIERRSLVFHAQNALPLRGGMIQLNDRGYVLKLMPDSLYAYLPYFGRAYSAPLNPTEGGIHLKTGRYRYQLSHNKSSWHLALFPSENTTVYRLDLDISSEGYASLQVTPEQRESIGYSGYVSGP